MTGLRLPAFTASIALLVAVTACGTRDLRYRKIEVGNKDTKVPSACKFLGEFSEVGGNITGARNKARLKTFRMGGNYTIVTHLVQGFRMMRSGRAFTTITASGRAYDCPGVDLGPDPAGR